MNDTDEWAATGPTNRSVLDYDPKTGTFTWKITGPNVKCGRIAGTLTNHGYTGKVDHINNFSSDNRISNLREANDRESAQNTRRRRDNTSGFKGV